MLPQQQKELIEQAASVIAADNVELGCCFIQKTAVERALADMDKRMAGVSLHYEFDMAIYLHYSYCDGAIIVPDLRKKVGARRVHKITIGIRREWHPEFKVLCCSSKKKLVRKRVYVLVDTH